ncbi:PspA/IM30 family protein [Qipengyuania aurantiaca]|uniref:PspA/IM30 family protein n=1 Tax=Qipengyuania aurantiaca TaxID=2867233 RepID=A0ABX8ZMX6_9SPHN|nr:PspA/IM30 family protein [Qipengyuania aurantiaca]QZD90340.1 PspA/IM30 family protein [Qipengyuania aurantiaca]
MFRIAIQVKELISSNVTSAIDSASNPAKMLARLQREIEEALVGLHGEVSKARRQKDRLENELTQAELREADWSDKAQIAMDNGREDLARQALMAREDCRAGIERVKQDIDRLSADITEMEAATRELEAKREDVRQRHADQTAADGNASGSGAVSGYASRTERRMDHIETLEKRTAFATEESAPCRGNASVEREIEEMRRNRKIEEELAAMRSDDKPAPAKKPAKKGGKRSKAA